jgi:hypothetical protein
MSILKRDVGAVSMAETDHPLKRLMTLAAVDFAAWLLGQPVRSVTTRPGAR